MISALFRFGSAEDKWLTRHVLELATSTENMLHSPIAPKATLLAGYIRKVSFYVPWYLRIEFVELQAGGRSVDGRIQGIFVLAPAAVQKHGVWRRVGPEGSQGTTPMQILPLVYAKYRLWFTQEISSDRASWFRFRRGEYQSFMNRYLVLGIIYLPSREHSRIFKTRNPAI